MRASLVSRLVRPIATVILLGCGSLASVGCATGDLPPPIVSKAALGQVIIYRNGVAFFERYAMPGEKELTLRVPAERVDDFLKSLTIVDDKTGETMPISYPTLNRTGDEVEMIIDLPKQHHGLRISYVTESPSWKPSYRLVLAEGPKAQGKARLQGWAVVDNVSGEDWKDVKVGVGSTSALSFRYDLHSVQTVQRETLSSGSLLAVAPPTGGMPYAAGKGNTVVANLSAGALADLEVAENERNRGEVAGEGEYARTTKSPQQVKLHTKVGGKEAKYVQVDPPPASENPWVNNTEPVEEYRPPTEGQLMIDGLANSLNNDKSGKIRIEGNAQSGDKDKRGASLARANKVRDGLIARGVDPAQVEAVGTGEVNEQEALRVVAVGESEEKEKGAGEGDAAVEGQPIGQAHFVSSTAMTIEKGHSAMVSILQQNAVAERVYYYDPISERGSKKFAFNAVRLVNPSGYTLDSGPFTVYVEGQFLGEGMTEPILPHATSFIPYALDRALIVEPEIDGREEIDKLMTIQRGIVTTETRLIRTTKLSITHRGSEDAILYVRHKVAPGYQLSTMGPKTPAPEKLGGAYLFKVKALAGQTVELTIDEWTPVERTVDIRTDAGIKAIALYLKASNLSAELKQGLDEVVKRHTNRTNIEEKIMTLAEQMEVYRTRVDELNVQLVTLKTLPQGEKLRSQLSKRMQEISEKLQGATMQLADLKGQLMSERIELQDKLAELTLKDERDGQDELAKKE